MDKTPHEQSLNEVESAHFLFCGEFELDKKKHSKITIDITADDYYKLYINGRFVIQDSANAYYSHYYYNTVDITNCSRAAKNK